MNEMIRMHLNLILSFTVSKQWLNKNGIRLIVWLSLLLLRWKCLKIANRPSQLQVWNLSSKTLQLGNQPQWSCRDSVRSAPRFKLNSTLNNICSLNPKIHGCNIIPRTIALADCPPKCPNTQIPSILCLTLTPIPVKGWQELLLSHGLMTWSGVTLDAQTNGSTKDPPRQHSICPSTLPGLLTSFRKN